MPADIAVNEDTHGLLIRVQQKHKITTVAVSVVAAVAVAAIAVSAYGGAVPAAMAGAIIALVFAIAVTRPRTAQLWVTNLDYVSRSVLTAGLFGTQHRLARADVRWLEFQEDTSGPESDHLGGLYAVLRWQSVCILPYVDSEQAWQIIDRIAAKFPDVANERCGGSRCGGHLISLELDGTD